MHRASVQARGEGLVGAMCYEPWLSAAITAEGNVGPCCAFWDPKSDTILDITFPEVWFGPYLQKIRQKLLDGHPPGYCAKCPSILYCQSEGLREQLRWHQMSAPRKACALAMKAISSARRYGLRRAIRRGREWVQIHKAR